MNIQTGGQGFFDTSKQVLSGFCMGMFLAGIYYRTGKFYLLVFIHGICNFSNFFMNEMLGWDYDLLLWDGALQAVLSLSYALLGMYLMKNDG